MMFYFCNASAVKAHCFLLFHCQMVHVLLATVAVLSAEVYSPCDHCISFLQHLLAKRYKIQTFPFLQHANGKAHNFGCSFLSQIAGIIPETTVISSAGACFPCDHGYCISTLQHLLVKKGRNSFFFLNFYNTSNGEAHTVFVSPCFCLDRLPI